MKNADDIKKIFEEAVVETNIQQDEKILEKMTAAFNETHKAQPERGGLHIGRIIMKSPITKLAAAAVFIVALVYLQTTVLTSKVYALSDVPKLIMEAKTIHVKMWNFYDGNKAASEYWFDLENGKFNHYWEGNPYKTHDGSVEFKTAFQNISDGRFIMNVDHIKKTSEYQKLLDCQNMFNLILLRDTALNMTLEDNQYLGKYTKVGKGEIDGQSFDIWQRQFKEQKSGLGIKYEVWVSPQEGGCGKIRKWIKDGRSSSEWILFSETEKIEKDIKISANIFSTVLFDGYTSVNTQKTAKIAGIGLEPFKYDSEYEIRVPLSFILEDGSILACWCGEKLSFLADSNEVFEQLESGGALPQSPISLYGLSALKNIERQEPETCYVGRHITYSHKEGKVYEWALYVPENKLESDKAISANLAILKLNLKDPNLPVQFKTGILKSMKLNSENFNAYIRQAFPELSAKEAFPDVMEYQNILQLAQNTRYKRDLYSSYKNDFKQALAHIAVLQPVEIVIPEKSAEQVKQMINTFFAAIVDGRNDDAVKILKYEPTRASNVVSRMKELPGIADIKVEDIYIDEESALVISSEFEAFEKKFGRWAISVVKEKGIWLIKDFDSTSTDNMAQQIEDFLKHFPEAQHFSVK